MSRRRRSGGIFGRLLEVLRNAWAEMLSWLLWPVFAVRDFFLSLFGGGQSSLRRRSWQEVAVDYLLLIPRWTIVFFQWLYQSMLKWPRIIRLRDLAAGLPALLAAAAAITIFFFLGKDEARLVTAYQGKSTDAFLQSRRETDEAKKQEDLKLAQFYSRALVKLKPRDQEFRYIVGYIYQEMGEHARAQAIMDSLAPRDQAGFAKAHVWQADQLLERPLDLATLDAAEAHLYWALPTIAQPEEVHRRLGELFYFRYRRYNPNTIDPLIPSRATYLRKAAEHLSQVKLTDPKLALTLADVNSLLGKNNEAELEVQRVISELTTRVDNVTSDIEARLMLAQAHRMVREFEKAADVLQVGIRLKPDRRYNEELSNVYYFQSRFLRQRVANSLPQQFDALRRAYAAHPANNGVTHRFIEALTSQSEEEAELARKTLQTLVEQRVPGQMAPLLLGFDCLRRKLPDKADDYLNPLRGVPADETPSVVAGFSAAVLSNQLRTIRKLDAEYLFDAALRVWPTNAELLTVQGRKRYAAGDFGGALRDFSTALAQRPKDAKLHEMLAATYDHLGQKNKAEEHRAQANSVRPNVAPLITQ